MTKLELQAFAKAINALIALGEVEKVKEIMEFLEKGGDD